MFSAPALSGDGAARREASGPPLDVSVETRRAPKLQPDWRRLRRKGVIGPGAPAEVCLPYNVLRKPLSLALHENGWRRIVVTSPTRRSGTTLTAINLAISLARDFHHSVLLVELNLIHPAFASLFASGPSLGMADYLLNDATLFDLPLDVGVERLLVIPAGAPVANSADLLSSPKMARFMEDLKRHCPHHTILFDLPSVLATEDAMVFAPLADCALLVVEEGETRIGDVRKAHSRLKPTELLGVVLNRSIA